MRQLQKSSAIGTESHTYVTGLARYLEISFWKRERFAARRKERPERRSKSFIYVKKSGGRSRKGECSERAASRCASVAHCAAKVNPLAIWEPTVFRSSRRHEAAMGLLFRFSTF
jgi:hypothetical protein